MFNEGSHVHTPIRVLFVCTDNSASSLMAEGILQHLAPRKFEAHSAGLHPLTRPHPLAMETLRQAGISTSGLHAKPMEEFVEATFAPPDIVITLHEGSHRKDFHYWSATATAHWPYPDPARFGGAKDEQREKFRHLLHQIRRRVELLANLPVEGIDKLRLEGAASEIALA